MTHSIAVNHGKCIKCSKCVKVCPALIFRQESPKEFPVTVNPETCIACGHCAAACPTGAVEHSLFPPSKVHAINKEALPSPGQMMEIIRARRSNRAFTKAPVPEEYLETILEAAHRAPTASNNQQVHFTLITDPANLHQLSSLTLGTFSKIAKKLSNPLVKAVLKPFMGELYKMIPRFHSMNEAFAGGYDPVLRGATAVILIHAPAESRFGCQDCNLAYQNASLMAESLGVTQFYTGFVCVSIKQDKSKAINSLIGTDEVIHAGIALGMPSFNYPNYIDKNDIVVKKM